jgi:hypothetical protein
MYADFSGNRRERPPDGIDPDALDQSLSHPEAFVHFNDLLQRSRPATGAPETKPFDHDGDAPVAVR